MVILLERALLESGPMKNIKLNQFTTPKTILLGSIAALALSACGGKEKAEVPTANAKPAITQTKLYTLDCGTIRISDLDAFSTAGDYAGQTDTFTDTCYLVRHPEGDLLWDLGLPAALIESGPQVNGIFTVSLEKTITDQLKEIDLTPKDIDLISISHSHFDHAGQAEQFPGTKWLVNDAEYAAMFNGTEAEAQYEAFKSLERVTIDGDHDVFGDGTVAIIDLPGHTPGHTGLMVKLENAGTILLTGDLFHRSESRKLQRVPQFNTDEPQTIDSMEKFEALASVTDARVIIQHEPDDIASLPKLPEALD